jgi:hypothetical protein
MWDLLLMPSGVVCVCPLLSVMAMATAFWVLDHLSPYGRRHEGKANWMYHVSHSLLDEANAG